jgi:rubredoxin
MAAFVEYRCLDCGYVHDETKSYSNYKVKAGTPFEKLPKNWVCPVCRKGKEMFVPKDR